MLEWSRRSGEWFMGLIRREVQRQMKVVGVATRDELSALKKRVRALERQAAEPKRTAKKASAKKSSAKKSSAKKSSAKKSSAKRSGKRAGE